MNYPSNLRNRLEPEKRNNASKKGWNWWSKGVEIAVKLIIIKGQCKTRVELNWVRLQICIDS